MLDLPPQFTHSIPRRPEKKKKKEGGTDGPRFQNILETVGNTPVVRINRLAPAGVDLFVKIEAFNHWARSRIAWRWA